jgi:hypothetical protein
MKEGSLKMKFASLVVALAIAAAVNAGCGGGDNTPNATASDSANAVKFSQCMREHGISDFPDPDSQGRMQINVTPGSDLDPNKPQFKAAQKACAKYQERAGGHFDKAQQQRMQQAALNYARCMRAHGVNFPDPQFSGGKVTMGGPGLNPNDPNFRSANQTCQKLMPGPKAGPGAKDGGSTTGSGGKSGGQVTMP